MSSAFDKNHGNPAMNKTVAMLIAVVVLVVGALFYFEITAAQVVNALISLITFL